MGQSIGAELLSKTMPPPIPVVLVAYDPAWPKMASIYAERLRVLGAALVGVHHIGSTSVPGLAAKPIIDLIPVVADLLSLDLKRPQIEAMGYSWHGELGMTGRRYCTLCDEKGTRLVQLHFLERGSPHIARHIALRDYLRAHPEEASAYENERRRARDIFPNVTRAQVYECLAYYEDHRGEIDALVAEQLAPDER